MIIAIASQKGGVGKTSTAISLSAGLVRQNKKVLLVDIDSQANASKVLLKNYSQLKRNDTICRTILDRKPLPVYKTEIKGLEIIPSHILLSETDMELTMARDHREARLKDSLDLISANYDYVFIDCPPALSWLTINAFTAADKILVVCSPGYFELDSLVQLSKTINEVKSLYNADVALLGFLFTMADPTINSRESLKILRQTYPDSTFKTVIPRNTDLRDAHFNRTTIFKFNPNAKSALAYQKLIKEILNNG